MTSAIKITILTTVALFAAAITAPEVTAQGYVPIKYKFGMNVSLQRDGYAMYLRVNSIASGGPAQGCKHQNGRPDCPGQTH